MTNSYNKKEGFSPQTSKGLRKLISHFLSGLSQALTTLCNNGWRRSILLQLQRQLEVWLIVKVDAITHVQKNNVSFGAHLISWREFQISKLQTIVIREEIKK